MCGNYRTRGGERGDDRRRIGEDSGGDEVKEGEGG
jgi:hypothetical protein